VTEQDAVTLIQKGISAAKSGRKREAYPLLRRATELEPGNKLGWLWLAGVAPSRDEAAACLRKVLELDPANRLALEGLAWIEARSAAESGGPAPTAQSVAPARQCPFCLQAAPEPLSRCPACGSLLTLERIEAFFEGQGGDRQVLQEAVLLLQEKQETEPTCWGQKHLALAYLNLENVERALHHLREAARLDGSDQELQEEVELLQSRIASAPGEGEEKERPIRVLIVDDSPTVRRLVTITLERHGHEVTCAEDGMAALAQINETLPDLVLLDINMPRMDGFQLCKTIRSCPATRRVPVVMLTGRDGLAEKVRARMVGCEEFLSKPFEPSELASLVERHARRVGGEAAELHQSGDRCDRGN
jgi:twitching motility two-component system response regulator PilG